MCMGWNSDVEKCWRQGSLLRFITVRILTVWLGKSRSWQTFLLAVVLPVRCNKISREEHSMNLAVPSAGPAPRGGLVVLISHDDTSLLWETGTFQHLLPWVSKPSWGGLGWSLWRAMGGRVGIESYRVCWVGGVQCSLLLEWVSLILLPLWSLFSIAIVRINDSAKSNQVKHK